MKNGFCKSGIPVRTLRFNLESFNSDDLVDEVYVQKIIVQLSHIAARMGVRWFNVPFDLTVMVEKDVRRACNVAFGTIKRCKNSFINVIVAQNQRTNPYAAIEAAKLILKIAKLSNNGFDNFRVGVSLNPVSETPFFPFSYAHVLNSFSIALEITKNLERIAAAYHDIDEVRRNAVIEIGDFVKQIEAISKGLAKELNMEFVGQDLSIAPYADERVSVVNLLKELGLENIGANGTFFFTSVLTDLIKSIIAETGIRSTGFCGIMYSLLEDHLMCKANNRRLLSIDALIGYSSLCGCGLDMVPVPQNISEEELASIILDISTISTIHKKPLGVRVLPIPNGEANDYTSFDTDFISNTRILPIKNAGCDRDIFEKSYFKYFKAF